MEVLFWFIFIVIAFGLFFRFFGRRLFMWFIKQLAKRAVKHMQNQSKAYEQQYSGSPYEEQIRTGDGVEVKIPKGFTEKKKVSRKPNLSVAEDVDYEELN